MAKVAPLRVPPLPRACPRWGEAGFLEWGTRLPPDVERSRSLGVSKVIDRFKGREVRGVVVGTTTPARPSAGDLLRRGESLCERGVAVRTDAGGYRVIQASRLRELNRTPRPMDPGLKVPALEALNVARRARELLEAGEVEASDDTRGGTLPYPHRAGGSSCSGANRPAEVLRASRDFFEGDGSPEGERALLERTRRMVPASMRREVQVNAFADIYPAAVAVEGFCVNAWAEWAQKALNRRAEIQAQRRAVREAYAPPKKAPKKKALKSYAAVAKAAPRAFGGSAGGRFTPGR